MACGGWRARDDDEPPLRARGDAEIKRMFVRPAHRGRGHARAVLADLERLPPRAGRRRMVLETGMRQPEAIGFYVERGLRADGAVRRLPRPPSGRYFSKALACGVIAPR